MIVALIKATKDGKDRYYTMDEAKAEYPQFTSYFNDPKFRSIEINIGGNIERIAIDMGDTFHSGEE